MVSYSFVGYWEATIRRLLAGCVSEVTCRLVLAGQGFKVINSFFGASIAPGSLVLRFDFRGRGGGRRMRSWNAQNWSAIQLQLST